MNGLDYCLKEFLPAEGKSALLVDTSAGLSLGALPGLDELLPTHAGKKEVDE